MNEGMHVCIYVYACIYVRLYAGRHMCIYASMSSVVLTVSSDVNCLRFFFHDAAATLVHVFVTSRLA